MNKIYLTLLSIVALHLSGFSQCTNLFFSEYVEGSSNNKAIEVFNPTTNVINLSTYQILQYRNGASTPSSVISLSGSLAPSATFVVANPSANAGIKAVADMLSGNVSYNGDDALVLVSGVDTLDIIGIKGDSAVWTVDTADTKDNTLVRKPTVNKGNTNWATAATEWMALPVDNITNLGMHYFNLCMAVTTPTLNFSLAGSTVAETPTATAVLKVVSNTPVASATDVTVTLGTMSSGGTAADVNGFTTATVTIPAMSTVGSTTITITDDAIIEGAETFDFTLSNPTAGATLGSQTAYTLTIGANDSVVAQLPFYPIGVITTTNPSTFVVDSANVRCRTSGVVYGVDYNRSTGLEFYIADHTGWIRVYSSSRNYGYTVNEGDSVLVQGRVTQFQGAIPTGMTQLLLDTVISVSAGNGLQAPKFISGREFRDEDESHLVRVNNLIYQSGWTNSGTGFTVKSVSATDATKQYNIRIDSVTTAYSLPAPTGPFNVVGLVTQYDTSSPYNFYYQVKPRYAADITTYNGVENIDGTVDAIFYPVPANNTLKYNVISENNLPVNYTITSVQGAVVATSSLEMNKGENYGNIDLSSLNSGFYFLNLQQGTKTSKVKITVIK